MCFGRKSIYYCVIRILCKNGKYVFMSKKNMSLQDSFLTTIETTFVIMYLFQCEAFVSM